MISFTFKKKGDKTYSNVKLADKMNELPDGKWEVKIKKFHKSRTLSQNNWYWEVITIIGNELGYDKNEMHECFKFTFLSDEKKGLFACKSTTELSTKEMSDYFEQIYRWAAEQGIHIPDPSEYNAT